MKQCKQLIFCLSKYQDKYYLTVYVTDYVLQFSFLKATQYKYHCSLCGSNDIHSILFWTYFYLVVLENKLQTL